MLKSCNCMYIAAYPAILLPVFATQRSTLATEMIVNIGLNSFDVVEHFDRFKSNKTF